MLVSVWSCVASRSELIMWHETYVGAGDARPAAARVVGGPHARKRKFRVMMFVWLSPRFSGHVRAAPQIFPVRSENIKVGELVP